MLRIVLKNLKKMVIFKLSFQEILSYVTGGIKLTVFPLISAPAAFYTVRSGAY